MRPGDLDRPCLPDATCGHASLACVDVGRDGERDYRCEPLEARRAVPAPAEAEPEKPTAETDPAAAIAERFCERCAARCATSGGMRACNYTTGWASTPATCECLGGPAPVAVPVGACGSR